jgi:hypothetical protein
MIAVGLNPWKNEDLKATAKFSPVRVAIASVQRKTAMVHPMACLGIEDVKLPREEKKRNGRCVNKKTKIAPLPGIEPGSPA